jgi:hypothetical protein
MAESPMPKTRAVFTPSRLMRRSAAWPGGHEVDELDDLVLGEGGDELALDGGLDLLQGVRGMLGRKPVEDDPPLVGIEVLEDVGQCRLANLLQFIAHAL